MIIGKYGSVNSRMTASHLLHSEFGAWENSSHLRIHRTIFTSWKGWLNSMWSQKPCQPSRPWRKCRALATKPQNKYLTVKEEMLSSSIPPSSQPLSFFKGWFIQSTQNQRHVTRRGLFSSCGMQKLAKLYRFVATLKPVEVCRYGCCMHFHPQRGTASTPAHLLQARMLGCVPWSDTQTQTCCDSYSELLSWCHDSPWFFIQETVKQRVSLATSEPLEALSLSLPGEAAGMHAKGCLAMHREGIYPQQGHYLCEGMLLHSLCQLGAWLSAMSGMDGPTYAASLPLPGTAVTWAHLGDWYERQWYVLSVWACVCLRERARHAPAPSELVKILWHWCDPAAIEDPKLPGLTASALQPWAEASVITTSCLDSTEPSETPRSGRALLLHWWRLDFLYNMFNILLIMYGLLPSVAVGAANPNV